jgi:TolB-like protein
MPDVRNKEILSSWKDISNYLDRSIRTCHKWEKNFGLPVYRIDDKSPRSKVFAFKSEIDQWLKERANNKRNKKILFFKNRWAIFGFLFILALLSIILTVFHFIKKNTFSLSSESISIAVLPFENLSTSEYDEYFSEGITNEIINKLTMLNNIKVVHANFASNYKQNFKTTKTASEELDYVDYIIKGKTKKDGKKIKLEAELIRMKDNSKIWSAEFEERLENIFSVQDHICLKIYETLGKEKPQKIPFANYYGKTHDYLAYDNYLKANYILSRLRENNNDPWKLYYQGIYYTGKCTRDSNELAINLFNQAIEIDSKFVLPYICNAT